MPRSNAEWAQAFAAIPRATVDRLERLVNDKQHPQHHLTRIIRVMGGKERGWSRAVCSCGWKHWHDFRTHNEAQQACAEHLEAWT